MSGRRHGRGIFDRYHIVDEHDLAEGVGRLARFVESRGQDLGVVPFREGHTEGHAEAVGGGAR